MVSMDEGTPGSTVAAPWPPPSAADSSRPMPRSSTIRRPLRFFPSGTARWDSCRYGRRSSARWAGELRVDFPDRGNAKGGSRSFFVADGFVQMLNNELTILAARGRPGEPDRERCGGRARRRHPKGRSEPQGARRVKSIALQSVAPKPSSRWAEVPGLRRVLRPAPGADSNLPLLLADTRVLPVCAA